MPIVALIFQSIPEAIIINLLGLVLAGLKIEAYYKRLIIVGLISGIFSYVIRSLPIPFGIHTLIHIPFLILILKYILEISFKKGSLIFMLGILVQLITELIYMPLLMVILNMSASEIVNNLLLRIIVPWPYLIILFLISLYLNKKSISIFPLITVVEAKIFNVKYLLVYLVLIQALLLGLINANIILGQEKYGKVPDQIKDNIIILSMLIIGTLLLSLYLVRKLIYSVRKEITLESQSFFLTNVNDMFISLKAQRHDFLNHIHTINGLIITEDYYLVQSYIKKLVKDTVKLNDIIKLDEPFLAALFRSKLIHTTSKNIKLNINCFINFNKLKIDRFELIRIIGNILDNSIEAVENLPLKDKSIDIKIYCELDEYCFEISNRTINLVMDKENLINEGFTTKEGHTGLGLFIVKNLVEKNKGELIIDYKENLITFKIKFPSNK